MRFLLDTHTFLWFVVGDDSLSTFSRELIENMENELFISVASLWEIAIKVSIGKLILKEPFEQLIPSQINENEFNILQPDLNVLNRVATLPFHHRDPFDRLLIAQAMISEMPLISKDLAFQKYNVTVIWDK